MMCLLLWLENPEGNLYEKPKDVVDFTILEDKQAHLSVLDYFRVFDYFRILEYFRILNYFRILDYFRISCVHSEDTLTNE